MEEEEIKGEESGRPQPILPFTGYVEFFYFNFKMDRQDAILDIQWLKKNLVRHRGTLDFSIYILL